MELRTIVIDDEPFSRDELIHLLKAHKEIKVVGEANSAENGLAVIVREEPNVVFLDIEKTGMDGIELAETLKKLKSPPSVIFATAYPDYAVKAFRLEAVDYLLKPFDESQVAQAVNRLIQMHTKSTQHQASTSKAKLAVQLEDRISYLDPNQVLYIYREGRETFIVAENGTFSSKIAIKELESKLSGFSFFRVHKGYLVNLDKVEELVSWSTSVFHLKLNNNKDHIPVSRNYVKELREALEL